MANPDNIVQIQYFANSNLIGTAASPPYGIRWTNDQQGQFVLTAKAVDRQGRQTVSKPVRVSSLSAPWIWGPRVLPGGGLLLFFSGWPSGATTLFSTDILQSVDNILSVSNWVGRILILDSVSGVFVDETLPVPAVTNRFYFWSGWAK